MTIENALYIATYEDYEGTDRVPCKVDTDKMEVVEFFPAEACRWDGHAMCIEEEISLTGGRTFDAIKFDEYADAVANGYEDQYGDRNTFVLFDADALYAACAATFPPPVRIPRFDDKFSHCASLSESSGNENDAYSYAERLACRGAEHIADVAPMMAAYIEDMEKVNKNGFYDERIASARKIIQEFEALAKQADELADKLRNTFRTF